MVVILVPKNTQLYIPSAPSTFSGGVERPLKPAKSYGRGCLNCFWFEYLHIENTKLNTKLPSIQTNLKIIC